MTSKFVKGYLLLLTYLSIGFLANCQQNDTVRIHRLLVPPDVEVSLFSDSSFIAINKVIDDSLIGRIRFKGSQMVFEPDTSMSGLTSSYLYEWLTSGLKIISSNNSHPLYFVDKLTDSSTKRGRTTVVGKYYRSGYNYHGYEIYLKQNKTFLIAERGHHAYMSFEKGKYTVQGNYIKLESKKNSLSKKLTTDGLFFIKDHIMISKSRSAGIGQTGKQSVEEIFYYFYKL